MKIILFILLSLSLSAQMKSGIYRYNTIELQVWSNMQYITKDSSPEKNTLHFQNNTVTWTSSYLDIDTETFDYIETRKENGYTLHIYLTLSAESMLIIDSDGYAPMIFTEANGQEWEHIVKLRNRKNGFKLD